MQTRTEQELKEEIKSTHARLAELHEELFARLNLNEPKQSKTHTVQEERNTPFKVGEQVEVLTRGIGANRGDTATITKVTRLRVSVTIDRNGRNTHRVPQNLKRIKRT